MIYGYYRTLYIDSYLNAYDVFKDLFEYAIDNNYYSSSSGTKVNAKKDILNHGIVNYNLSYSTKEYNDDLKNVALKYAKKHQPFVISIPEHCMNCVGMTEYEVTYEVEVTKFNWGFKKYKEKRNMTLDFLNVVGGWEGYETAAYFIDDSITQIVTLEA